MSKTISAALLLCLLPVACTDPDQDLAALRANVGKNACNAANGAYRGRIVDVTHYSAAGQSPSAVYVVERQGRRINAPSGNTSVVTGNCPDGQPGS